MSRTDNLHKHKLPPPSVSIIVPVYNVEKQLYSCLMSAVYQTLTDTEVIVVNDASPDNSQTIIDQFVAAFPDKVRCAVYKRNRGVACARKRGLRLARAPYVIFIDSDDFISSTACEELLQAIRADNLDMVYSPSLRCWEVSEKEEILPLPEESGNDALIKNGLATFCGTIFRKTFLLEHADIAFLPMQFEDAAAIPALLSRTDRVGVYRKNLLYYYRYEREGSTCTQPINEKKMLDTFSAETIGLKNVAAAYQRDYTYRVIKRACAHLRKEPAVYDYAVLHLKKIIKATSAYQEAYPQGCLKIIEHVMQLPDEIRIPKIVYVNGFIKDELKDFSVYMEEARRAYRFNPDVRVLDEQSCNTETLPRWVRAMGPHEWGLYFAVEEIAKRGGLYISPTVRVATSFNREAFRSAFFASGKEATILPCAFGGTPDSPLFNEILQKAGQEEPSIKFRGMADCMARAVIEAGGVHLDGSEEYGPRWMPFHILSFGDVFRSLTPEKSYCILDWSNFKTLPEEFLSVPKALNDRACKDTEKLLEEAASKIQALETEKKAALAKAAAAEKKLRHLRSFKAYILANNLHYFRSGIFQKKHGHGSGMKGVDIGR